VSVFEVKQGNSPIILTSPHGSTDVEPAIWARLNERGQRLVDTDWHIDRLYDDLIENVTTVRAKFHRYVIDANRDPLGISLYPGQNTTTLIPTTDFENFPIWCEGKEPTDEDIQDRLVRFHAPYHAALTAEITRIKALHGVAILYDCHSITSPLPFLFDGRLPDFNIGTNDGTTCAPIIEKAIQDIAQQAEGYTYTFNGRFKGGWTTRHYGKPSNGVHAIQMELVRENYLVSHRPPFDYDEAKATRLRPYLQQILHVLHQLAPTLR